MGENSCVILMACPVFCVIVFAKTKEGNPLNPPKLLNLLINIMSCDLPTTIIKPLYNFGIELNC